MTAATKLSWVSPAGSGGALIAGFAAGLLVRLLNRLGRRIPEDLQQVRRPGCWCRCSSLLGIVGWLMAHGRSTRRWGGSTSWTVRWRLPSCSGGSRLVLGAVLGALMATDYGGPINKAAYVTGTLACDQRASMDLMAAVMVGRYGAAHWGWRWPACCSRTRFTKAERRTAPQNLADGGVLCNRGCAALCPARPAARGARLHGRQQRWPGSWLCCLAAAALRPTADCSCIAVIGNPLGFLAALAAGSLLTTLLVGMLKKPVKS